MKSEPKTCQVTVNNIGVKPAGEIATLALHKSAEKFREEFLETWNQLKNKSYADDLGLTTLSEEELDRRIIEADLILTNANMQVKKWIWCSEMQSGLI